MTDTASPVAVITGASSGIGAATACSFARRGYSLVLAARRVEMLNQVADTCRAKGCPAAMVVPTDVADRAQVDALVAAAADRFGRIDVLVNNAGYGHFGRVHELDETDLRAIFDANFFGLFYGCRAVAPIMIRQRSGHIFNVSSVIGKRGSPFHGAYSATKFAVGGLTESMRVELAPYHIRVTLVCPALTETEFYQHVRRGQSIRAKSRILTRSAMMPAQKVADRIARTAGHRKPELVFTAGGRFLVILNTLWPRAADRLMKFYHDDLVRAVGLAGDNAEPQASDKTSAGGSA